RFTTDVGATGGSVCGVSSERLFESAVEEGKILSIRSDRIAEACPSSAVPSVDRRPAFQNRPLQPVEGSTFQVMSHWHHPSSLAMQDVSVKVAGGNPWTFTGTAAMMP